MNKREILEAIATDQQFVIECMRILKHRTTERIRCTSPVPLKSHGFMTSHAPKGLVLSHILGRGKPITQEEFDWCRSICMHYPKQIAQHIKEEAPKPPPKRTTKKTPEPTKRTRKPRKAPEE